ncbi:MAG: potassium channel family protein [Candidatus Micrarchaeia archaeon]
MDAEARTKLFAAIFSLAFIVSAGTVGYHYIENWSWVDALYFSSVTITTVGFGDIVPKTDVGKLFTVAYAFIGIGVALYTLASFGEAYVETRVETKVVKDLTGMGARFDARREEHKARRKESKAARKERDWSY